MCMLFQENTHTHTQITGIYKHANTKVNKNNQLVVQYITLSKFYHFSVVSRFVKAVGVLLFNLVVWRLMFFVECRVFDVFLLTILVMMMNGRFVCSQR